MYQPLYLMMLVFAVNALQAEEQLTEILPADPVLAAVDPSNEQKIPVAIELKSNEELNQEQPLAAEKILPIEEEKLQEEKSDLSGSESAWGGWGGWGGRYYPSYYGGWGRSYNYPRYYNNGWRRFGYFG